MEIVSPLVYVPTLIELLNIPMSTPEAMNILSMIASRMLLVHKLFVSEPLDEITRLRIRNQYQVTWSAFGLRLPEEPRIISDATNNLDLEDVVVDIYFRTMLVLRVYHMQLSLAGARVSIEEPYGG